ncbi:LytR/AlgR family response regulator transcription factor [Pedobacter sp. NJ-S-72]
MMLTCIIIEDEPLAQELLQDYINRRGDLSLLGKFNNVNDFIKFKENKIDLMFMDIKIRGNVKEDVESLFSQDSSIVLVTAYTIDQLSDYNLSQISNVLYKPVSYEKFNRCIDGIYYQRTNG